MAQVFLHIGQYKTGSTALQSMLWHGRDRLHAAGVLYPETFLRGQAHFAISDHRGKSARLAKGFAALAEEIAASGAEQVILSNEALSGYSVQDWRPRVMAPLLRDLRDGLAGHRVVAICYLRRQDEAVESRIIQAIKGNCRSANRLPDPYLVTKSALDYGAFCGHVREHLAPDALILRPYGRDLSAGRDIGGDILTLLGQPPDLLDRGGQGANVAPSGELLEVLRIANLLAAGRPLRDGLFRKAWQTFGRRGGARARVLDAEARQRVMAHFRPANQAFLRDHCPADQRAAFESLLMAPPAAGAANLQVAFEDLMDFFGWHGQNGLIAPYWQGEMWGK